MNETLRQIETRLEEILDSRTEDGVQLLRGKLHEAYFSTVDDRWTNPHMEQRLNEIAEKARVPIRYQERKRLVREITPSPLGG